MAVKDTDAPMVNQQSSIDETSIHLPKEGLVCESRKSPVVYFND